MILHVGPTEYSVVLSDRRIFNAEGDELEAAAIYDRRLIVLSKTIEPARREEVVRHEFYHCWTFHVPTPRSDEESARLHTTVAGQFESDLEAAGGADALLNMRPTAVVMGRSAPARLMPLPSTAQAIGRTDRIVCGGCEAEVMTGSIETGPAIPHEATSCFYVERWCHCEACGAVQAWCEFASSDGRPLGEFCPVPRPRLLRGDEARRWMVEHQAHV
jgi:hypothetical protein